MEQITFNPEPLWIARKRQKLTQEDVARRLGKHRLTVIRMETGAIRGDSGESLVALETIREYAKILGVDPAEVLGEEVCAP